MSKRVLFVTWDGPQVSYLEGLFFPIFKRLKSYNYSFYILQFTWSDKALTSQKNGVFIDQELNYKRVSIRRQFGLLGYLVTAFIGYRTISRLIDRHSIDIVMSRAILPSLICMLSVRNKPVQLIFDADGLPLDESVDFRNQSPSSLLYRYLRDVESEMVRRSSIVLSRTQSAIHVLQSRAGAGTDLGKFVKVRNGRDITRYTPFSESRRHAIRFELGIDPSVPLVVYAGSLGAQYCFKEMIIFYKSLINIESSARLLILTNSPAEIDWSFISEQAFQKEIIVKGLEFEKVSPYLACSDLGIAFRSNKFSMQGVAPIKIGEYLLCGLPVILSRTDSNELISHSDCGFVIDSFCDKSFTQSAKWFSKLVLNNRESYRSRCRALGIAHFGLDNAVQDYRKALDSLFLTK
jgi:glycosyltransferase involved in cell wall biosynthesis